MTKQLKSLCTYLYVLIGLLVAVLYFSTDVHFFSKPEPGQVVDKERLNFN